MSTYYYLCCDKCGARHPLWGRWVGGSGLLPTAAKDPGGVTYFTEKHKPCGPVVLVDEYDDGRMEYVCPEEDMD